MPLFWKTKKATGEAPISEPTASAEVSATAAESTPPPVGEVELPEPSPEIADALAKEARAMVEAGHRPEQVFVLQSSDGTGLISAPLENAGTLHALFFSTPAFAAEYSRALHLNASVGSIRTIDLPQLAEGLKQMAGFSLNRCPRCSILNLFSLEALKNPEQFDLIWALDASVKRWNMNRLARGLPLEIQEHPELAASTFLTIRDHVDPGVPIVHFVLALLSAARFPGTTPELGATSKQRLVELGRPDLSATIPSDWLRAAAEAIVVIQHIAQGTWNIAPRSVAQAGSGG